MKTRNSLTLLALSTAILLSSCQQEAATDAAPATPTSQASVASDSGLPASLFVSVAPEGARDVVAVKKSAKEGDIVVIRGKIGGDKEPFVDGRAIMMIADTKKVTSCEGEEEGCPKPWDYCCEDPDDLRAATASVQLTDENNAVLKFGLDKQHGIAPLKIVVVEGKVGPRPNKDVLTINATAIHVEP